MITTSLLSIYSDAIFSIFSSELLGDEQFCSNSIFGFEVNIHASQKSSLPALSTGSSKVLSLGDVMATDCGVC